MKNYEVTFVTHEYRTVYVEAESLEEARDKAWDNIETHMSNTPDDGDTDIYSVEESINVFVR